MTTEQEKILRTKVTGYVPISEGMEFSLKDVILAMDEPLSILKMEASTRTQKVVITPERLRYLLSKGFDLFGLIDAGLAIDKTK